VLVSVLAARLVREESGFTLPELLVSAAIGVVVVLAGFMVLDQAGLVTTRITDREDAAQRARAAIRTITTELRSQVCLGATSPAINAGSDGNNLTFYEFTGAGTFQPERHTLAFDPTHGTLTEYDYASTGTFPNLSFPSSPTRTVQLLTDAQPVSTGAAVFTYYTWTTGGQVDASNQLPAPLSATDAARAVKVAIQLRVSPPGRSTSAESTTIQDEVLSRTADPNATAGPSVTQC